MRRRSSRLRTPCAVGTSSRRAQVAADRDEAREHPDDRSDEEQLEREMSGGDALELERQERKVELDLRHERAVGDGQDDETEDRADRTREDAFEDEWPADGPARRADELHDVDLALAREHGEPDRVV